MKQLPKGADQQGRYPEATGLYTDIGQETEDMMWFWVVCVVIITAVLAAAAWKVLA
jgi:hypothetical protein